MKRYGWMMLALAGCSDDETAPAPELSPDADACEHFEAGPFASVDAAADPMDAPDVSESHTAYRISVADHIAGEYVSLAIAAAGEVLFYTDGHCELYVEDANGVGVSQNEDCNGASCSTECALVRGRHAVLFETVGTYYLQLFPTDPTDGTTLVHFSPGEHEH